MGGGKPRFYDQAASFQTQKRQEIKKKQRTSKVFKYSLLVVVVIVLFGAAWKVPTLWDKIRKPFKQEQGVFINKGKINYNLRTNILLINVVEKRLSEIGLLSIEPGAKTASVLTFSPDALVDSEVGKLTLSQVYSLSSSNNLDSLKAVLIENFGYPIDGYLSTSDSAKWVDSASARKIAKNLFGVNFFLNLPGIKGYLDEHLYTNLTLKNTFDLASKISSLAGEKFTFFDFGAGVDLSGVEASRKVGLALLDSAVSSENASIEIVNASDQAGLGSVLKEVAANLGINVLSVESASVQDKTEILVANKKVSKTITRLENILLIRSKDTSVSNNQFDIKVIIGKDFSKYFDLDKLR